MELTLTVLTWSFANNSGSFANSGGPIKLSGTFNFGGGNFAIISNGNIDLTGATINLSGPASSGNLTLLAGFDFSPSTSGVQTFSKGTYNNFTPTGTGSILGSATVNATGGTGNGGNVIAFANGGVVELGNINVSSTSGNGGTVKIVGSNGISVGAVNANGVVDGDVSFDVANPLVSNNFAITNGGISAGSALAPISLNAGNLSFGAVTANNVNIRAGASSANTITNTGALSANHVILNGFGANTTLNGVNAAIFDSLSNGSVTVDATSNIQFNLSGSQSFAGTSTGNIVVGSVLGQQSSLSLTGNSIDATFGVSVAGNASLTTTGGALTGNVGASTMTINANGSIGSGANRFVTSAGVIAFHTNNSVTLSAVSGAGVQFNSSDGGAGQLVDIDASGPVTGSIAADVLKLTTSNDSVGTSLNPLNISSIGSATTMTVATGSGDIFLKNTGTGEFRFDGSSGSSLSVDAGNAAVKFINNNSTFAGDINVIANSVTNNVLVKSTGGDINIQSQAASGLSIIGGSGATEGFWEATSGNIKITTNNALSLQGDTTYNTTAQLQAQTINVDSGDSTAIVNSILLTPNLNLNGGNLVTLGATWILINSRTLGNNPGDINLNSNQVIQSGNFAILAAGDINLNNILIDLSGPNTGGNLTMIAGYNFSQNTGGTQQFLDGITIDSFTPSTGGGSITGTATIDLHGTAGSGGSLIAVAHAGDVSSGSIQLGNINTQGNTNGGNVLVIGEGGVTVGNVITTNASANSGSGSIGLYSATPNVPTGTGFQVLSGVPTGVISPGTFTNNGVSANILNAGRSVVNVFAGPGTGGSLSVSTGITARDLTMQGNTIAFGFSNLTANVGVGQNGQISLSANTIAGSSSTLTLNTGGATSGDGGAISLNLLGSGPTTFGTTGNFELIASSNSGVGVAGLVDIASNGDITLNSGAINASGLNNSGEIAINTTGNLTVNASSLTARTGAGSGAQFTLNAGLDGSGTLSLNDASFFGQANASVGSNGDGGRLELSGQIISTPGLGTSATPLTLTARGDGTGDGGHVIFNTNETLPTFVGVPLKAPKPPARFLQIFAGGGGDAGTIELRTGGNLTINNVGLIDTTSTHLAAGPLKGASYTLEAGKVTTGALVITGNLSGDGFNGGDAGVLTLRSNSSTAFAVNPSKRLKKWNSWNAVCIWK